MPSTAAPADTAPDANAPAPKAAAAAAAPHPDAMPRTLAQAVARVSQHRVKVGRGPLLLNELDEEFQ
eukprot:11186528-Lingulodinium_polyedra.AAC.1